VVDGREEGERATGVEQLHASCAMVPERRVKTSAGAERSGRSGRECNGGGSRWEGFLEAARLDARSRPLEHGGRRTTQFQGRGKSRYITGDAQAAGVVSSSFRVAACFSTLVWFVMSSETPTAAESAESSAEPKNILGHGAWIEVLYEGRWRPKLPTNHAAACEDSEGFTSRQLWRAAKSCQ
jgi:hypothetical protein